MDWLACSDLLLVLGRFCVILIVMWSFNKCHLEIHEFSTTKLKVIISEHYITDQILTYFGVQRSRIMLDSSAQIL